MNIFQFLLLPLEILSVFLNKAMNTIYTVYINRLGNIARYIIQHRCQLLGKQVFTCFLYNHKQ